MVTLNSDFTTIKHGRLLWSSPRSHWISFPSMPQVLPPVPLFYCVGLGPGSVQHQTAHSDVQHKHAAVRVQLSERLCRDFSPYVKHHWHHKELSQCLTTSQRLGLGHSNQQVNPVTQKYKKNAHSRAQMNELSPIHSVKKKKNQDASAWNNFIWVELLQLADLVTQVKHWWTLTLKLAEN